MVSWFRTSPASSSWSALSVPASASVSSFLRLKVEWVFRLSCTFLPFITAFLGLWVVLLIKLDFKFAYELIFWENTGSNSGYRSVRVFWLRFPVSAF